MLLLQLRFGLVRPLCKPLEDDIEIMFRLVTGRITLLWSVTTPSAPRLTDTTRPPISPRRISRIMSSTLSAPGRSFLFAKTRSGIPASPGSASRACSSDVLVGRDLI